MGKVKTPKKVPNKQIHSRVSYLYQAAAYLAANGNAEREESSGCKVEDDNAIAGEQSGKHSANDNDSKPETYHPSDSRLNHDVGGTSRLSPRLNPQRQLLSQARAISLKGQIRMSRDVKRSICKRCNTLLTSGSTCTDEIENKSKGGKKPWADVHVITCLVCGTPKRFPVGAKRQPSLGDRSDLRQGQPEAMATKAQSSET